MAIDMSAYSLTPRLHEDPAIRERQHELVREIRYLGDRSRVPWTDDDALKVQIEERVAELEKITPPPPPPQEREPAEGEEAPAA